MANDKIFPKGVTCFPPHQNAPGYVLAQVIITPRDLVDWLKGDGLEYLKDSKYGKQLKLILKNTKEGKPYLEVDTYDKTQESKKPDTPTDDLPF